MNRRQEERVADLGRAYQETNADIPNLREPAQDEVPVPMEAYDREEVCRTSPSPAYPRLAQHVINIQQVHNGFIVSAGCQTFVFESFDKLAKYMAIYYDDPQGTYKKHYKGELLK